MNSIQTNYQALIIEESEEQTLENVVFHAASEEGRSHWNHIGDLDSFFRKVYDFHQKHGFGCLLMEEGLQFLLLVLVIFVPIYCFHCVLFNFDAPSSPIYNKTVIHFNDLSLPLGECAAGFGTWTYIFIIAGALACLYKFCKIISAICGYYEIRNFYTTAMKINMADINDTTWHEVQCRLREVQHEQQLCVHKSDLTELDIYHRILRNKNYMVALVNKNLLPLKYNLFYFGDWIYFSTVLEYCIEWLLFGPYSPFKETGKLKEEYKKYSKRKEAADELKRKITILAAVNLVLMPFIFIYQLLNCFVTYSGIVRHMPGFLSTRRWSLYSRLYLRHFNELDHELHARLSRAYKPSKEYMKSFSSPTFTIAAKFIAQICGCLMVFFGTWGAFKERLLLVDGYFFIVTVCGIMVCCYGFLPPENAIYYPNLLMERIIADIHYVPDHFKQQAHTLAVRDEFSQLYQYTFISILEEIISPIVTPIILYNMRNRSLDIVDFFRSFTVDVGGVGDVCSFALMDVSRHGNHHWQSETHTKADQHQQAENGKTELSLIHFTLMNPQWKPPPSSHMFINDFREKVHIARETQDVGFEDPYYASLTSLSTMGSKYASLVNSIHGTAMPITAPGNRMICYQSMPENITRCKQVSHAEGPAYIADVGLLTSNVGGAESLHCDMNPLEIRAADMSFSALYLHEVHQRHMESSRSQGHSRHHHQPSQESINNGDEESPLLDVRVGNYVQ